MQKLDVIFIIYSSINKIVGRIRRILVISVPVDTEARHSSNRNFWKKTEQQRTSAKYLAPDPERVPTLNFFPIFECEPVWPTDFDWWDLDQP